MKINTWVLAISMLAGATSLTFADDLRLANGKKITGTIKSTSETGLEVETPKGVKTIPWSNLSAGTRFVHQPAYRDNIDAILKGLPSSARTNRVEEVKKSE